MRDQDYALAYAGLADCYLLLNVYNVTSADESYPESRSRFTQGVVDQRESR